MALFLLCFALLFSVEDNGRRRRRRRRQTRGNRQQDSNARQSITSHLSLLTWPLAPTSTLLHCCLPHLFLFFSFFFFSLALFLLCKQANFDGLSLWRKWVNDIVIFRHWSGVIHSIHQQRKRKEGEEERKRKRQKATKQGFVQVKSKREKQRKKKQPLVTERAEQRRAAVHPV